MPRVTVMGAGVCGLATGLLLARDGHEVTVLERDPAPVPDTMEEAWATWERGGVSQFRQAHHLHPGGRAVLDEELPDVREALAGAGAVPLDPTQALPPTITDRAPRPGDERFRTLTARRPVIEHVMARAAEEQPDLEVRRGTGVAGLTTRRDDGPIHVTGVRTEAGEELRADLVVDALGRRSPLPGWLRDAGAPPMVEEAEDSGFIYYTRFYASRDGAGPPVPMAPPLSHLDAFSILTLLADQGTWSVTVYVAAGDRPLKAIRHPERFDAVLRTCPLHAHWLDGEPLTGVAGMGGVVDRYRRPVSGGRPVARGIVAVADAWACTNPSLGRGITLGLRHARTLRDVVRDHADDPAALAEAWDAATEETLTPWYRDTVAEDRQRARQLVATREGRTRPAPADESAEMSEMLAAAAMHDADVFRGYLDTRGCHATLSEVMARPGLADRVRALAAEHPPTAIPGPDRARLLALLAA